MIDSLTAIRRLTRLTWTICYGLSLARRCTTPLERAQWQQQQALRMLRALETKVIVSGEMPTAGLLVLNHLSYLDVVVIAAQAPVVFVSKSEVANWPLIGRLLKAAGTILADRQRRSSACETSAEMLHALNCGLPVIFFPEGTSSNGTQVLPFKPALLQIALNTHKPITPAAINYTTSSGDLTNDVCYWGDHTFASHIIRLAKIRQLSAHLKIGLPPTLPSDRKSAARTLHTQVVTLHRDLVDGN